MSKPITFMPEVAVDLDAPECKRMKAGDVVTISGVRLYDDGSMQTDCNPGQETRFIVKGKISSVHTMTNDGEVT